MSRARRASLPFASCLAVVTAGAAARADVAVDGTPSSEVGAASTTAWTHTVGAGGRDRYVLVGVSIDHGGVRPRVQGVTFAGRAMSFVGAAQNDMRVRVELWGLASPPEGAQPVSVRLDAAAAHVAGALSLTGVGAALTAGSATGNGGTASVAVTGAAGGLVVDVIGTSAGDAPTAIGRTRAWSRAFGVLAAASTMEGAGALSPSWRVEGGQRWGLVAVPLRAPLPPGPDAGPFDASAPRDVSEPADAAAARDAGADASERLDTPLALDGGPAPLGDGGAASDRDGPASMLALDAVGAAGDAMPPAEVSGEIVRPVTLAVGCAVSRSGPLGGKTIFLVVIAAACARRRRR